MNEFGNLLYTLRKEKGWTQTELADKLGVTNQAVSKWETGDCFPETTMLMPLAQLFDVTADELLKGQLTSKQEQANVENERVFVDVKEKAFKKYGGIVFFATLICYLVCGFVWGLWHPAWIVFPIGLTIIKLFSVLDKTVSMDIRICKIIANIVWFLALVAYIICGFCFNLWHPTWIVFLVAMLTEQIAKRKYK